jgi:hypothetical protein
LRRDPPTGREPREARSRQRGTIHAVQLVKYSGRMNFAGAAASDSSPFPGWVTVKIMYCRSTAME